MAIDTCPRCGEGCPSNAQRGEFEGPRSVVDETVTVCTQCSLEEHYIAGLGKAVPPVADWPVTPTLSRP